MAFVLGPVDRQYYGVPEDAQEFDPGRRGGIFMTALCLTATPIGSAFAKSWQGLFAVPVDTGIGIGAKNATAPIYSAEISVARTRGALVMF
ncbi:General substrate transporter [Penicillium sp. DV-2018c]|nr:General substrate transporter [Penicillium sp. DV-2018c]